MKPYQHPKIESVPLTAVMHALSDQCRVDIVQSLLLEKEKACGEFTLNVSKSTASHHFEVLRAAGLIRTRIVGNRCLNSLRRDDLTSHFPHILPLLAQNSVQVS